MAVIRRNYQDPNAGFIELLQRMGLFKQQEAADQAGVDRRLQADKDIFDYKNADEAQKAAAIGKILEMFQSGGRPMMTDQVRDDGTGGRIMADDMGPLQTKSLGDMSGLAGVLPAQMGAPEPGMVGPPDPNMQMQRGLEQAVGGMPTPELPIEKSPLGMREDYDRKMTTEEVLPLIQARLAGAGASSADIQNFINTMQGRLDFQAPTGGVDGTDVGTDGEMGSTYQDYVRDAALTDVEAKKAMVAQKSGKDYEYSESRIRAVAEGLARGEYKSWSEALSGRDPELKPLVAEYMDKYNLHFVPPKVRMMFADVQSTKKGLENISKLWDKVESADGLPAKYKAYKNFNGIVQGILASMKSVTGDSGVMTDVDATRLEGLLAVGKWSQFADMFTKDGTSWLPEVKERHEDAKKFFLDKVSAYMGGYYWTWEDIEGGGYVDRAFPREGATGYKGEGVMAGPETTLAEQGTGPLAEKPSLEDLWNG